MMAIHVYFDNLTEEKDSSDQIEWTIKRYDNMPKKEKDKVFNLTNISQSKA